MRLKLQKLTFSYSQDPVLKNVSFQVSDSHVVALVGPNAAGKSTLLKCLAGIYSPEGKILFGQKNLKQIPRNELQDSISYLPQSPPEDVSMTVLECVLLGRMQRLTWHVSNSTIERVSQVLEALQMEHLAERSYSELSGGQKQMVGIAQALVKTPELFLLDEPTAGLDLHHRFDILDRIQEITKQKKLISFLALHDVNLAALYADQVVVLDDGTCYGIGTPREMFTTEMFRDVYNVKAKIHLRENETPQIFIEESMHSNGDH